MNKAIFLDRDGTINVEKNYLYKIEDFEYLDGVVEGLKRLQEVGFLLIIITNQSGIGRGYYSEDDFHKLTGWMENDLAQKGVKITKTYYCPHFPDSLISKYAINCNCRKPNTGLFWKAQKEFDIDMQRSFAIGDKLRDLEICKETSIKGILLADTEELREEDKDVMCCSSFIEACDYISFTQKD